MRRRDLVLQHPDHQVCDAGLDGGDLLRERVDLARLGELLTLDAEDLGDDVVQLPRELEVGAIAHRQHRCDQLALPFTHRLF